MGSFLDIARSNAITQGISAIGWVGISAWGSIVSGGRSLISSLLGGKAVDAPEYPSDITALWIILQCSLNDHLQPHLGIKSVISTMNLLEPHF